MDMLNYLKGGNQYGINVGALLVMISMNDALMEVLRGYDIEQFNKDDNEDITTGGQPAGLFDFNHTILLNDFFIQTRMSGMKSDAKFNNFGITGIVNISTSDRGLVKGDSINICHFLFRRNSCLESGDFYLHGTWDKHLYNTFKYLYAMASRYQNPHRDQKMQAIFEKYRKKELKYKMDMSELENKL